MKKIFDKVKNSSKRSKVLAVVLATAVCVTSIWHGLADKPAVVNADAANIDENESYMAAVVDRMMNDPTSMFTILEIVPYDGMGEFRYYVGEDEIIEGSADGTIPGLEGRQDMLKNNSYHWWNDTEWHDIQTNFSNFGYKIRKNEKGLYEIKCLELFLNKVVPEYRGLLDGAIDVRTVEANKLTAADIEAADMIYISTGSHDNNTLNCYEAFTGKTGTDHNIYAKNANGTYKQLKTIGEMESYSYNSYEKVVDAEGNESYVSRDMSWDMVLMLWQYTIAGKTVTKSDGTEIVTTVPALLDNECYSKLPTDGNMYKYQMVLRMMTKAGYDEVLAHISTKSKSGTDKDYINSAGILTAELSFTDSFPDDADLTWSTSNDFYKYLADPYNSPAELVDKYYNMQYDSMPNWLESNFWIYNGNSSLIPANQNSYVSGDNIGYEDRTGVPATAIDVMRYLLGAKEDPISKSTVQVKILEIQPCAYYDYDDFDAVYELAEKMALAVDGLDDSGNQIFDPLTEENYKDPSKKVCISVDCMTSSAFNGINKDVVADYDAIILGDNDDLLVKEKGVTIYNDSSLDGYIYLAFGDMIKAKTGVSMYYKEDFVDATNFNYGSYVKMNGNADVNGSKITSLTDWNDRLTNSTYGPYTSLKYITYNRVYQLNESTKELWNPLLYNTLTKGKYYVLENVNLQISGVTTNQQLFNKGAGNLRYSGNDITQLKCEQLKEFIDSGRPVVMGEELYKYTNASTTIYPTSNMAEIAKYAIDKNGTRIKEDRIGRLVVYLKNDNPVLTVDTLPPTVTYEQADIDGDGVVDNVQIVNEDSFNDSNILNFKFTINGKANTKYKVLVYMDKNNDGVFDKTANETDDRNENFWDETYEIGESGAKFIEIEAELSENYSGLISYKIEVIELKDGVEQPYRAGITGYTAVKSEAKKPIKVLQILPIPTKSSNDITLNLQTNEDFNDLLEDAALSINYNIDVRAVYTSEYESWFEGAGNAYNPNDVNTNHLAPYDMVVLGFADLYCGDDISNDNGALDCLYDFVDSGKAALFTHDTVGYSNSVNGMTYTKSGATKTLAGFQDTKKPNVWATSISRTFREIVGMDRYGISSAESLTAEELKNAPYDKDGNLVTDGLQGINNMLAMRHSNRELDGLKSFTTTRTSANSVYKLYPYSSGASYITNSDDVIMTTTKVTKLNTGQVTMYPYYIPDDLTVATTHAQWYQLDMEDDSIVVWYTLNGDEGVTATSQYYEDTDRDAANNYYIYSKGNITYSGAGHSDMNSEEELQLFVNTVIKAISAGNNVPEVKVVKSSYADGYDNIYVTPYSENYEFDFYGVDLDLRPEKGIFKDATVTWLNTMIDINGDGITTPVDADGDGVYEKNDYVTVNLSNKVVCEVPVTLSIGGTSTFSELTSVFGNAEKKGTYTYDTVDDEGNTITVEKTLTYKEAIDMLINGDVPGQDALFEVTLTDIFDYKGIANIRLIKRDLFSLD